MKGNKTLNPSDPAKAEGELKCTKCDHINPSGSEYCQACGSRLYIFCKRCNHRNLRAALRCARCGRRLHHSMLRQWEKKLRAGSRARITPGQAALLILVVLIAYKIIIRLAEYTPPPPEP